MSWVFSDTISAVNSETPHGDFGGGDGLAEQAWVDELVMGIRCVVKWQAGAGEGQPMLARPKPDEFFVVGGCVSGQVAARPGVMGGSTAGRFFSVVGVVWVW